MILIILFLRILLTILLLLLNSVKYLNRAMNIRLLVIGHMLCIDDYKPFKEILLWVKAHFRQHLQCDFRGKFATPKILIQSMRINAMLNAHPLHFRFNLSSMQL